jgi:hypothetical protein
MSKEEGFILEFYSLRPDFASHAKTITGWVVSRYASAAVIRSMRRNSKSNRHANTTLKRRPEPFVYQGQLEGTASSTQFFSTCISFDHRAPTFAPLGSPHRTCFISRKQSLTDSSGGVA